MKLVLDTNAVSALMKGDPQFLERLKQSSKAELSVPQPVLAEIAYGIERLPASKREGEPSAALRSDPLRARSSGLDGRGHGVLREHQGDSGTGRAAHRGLRCRDCSTRVGAGCSSGDSESRPHDPSSGSGGGGLASLIRYGFKPRE